MTPDIRWKQRLANYRKAVGQMTRFIQKGELNEFEVQGLVQCFEYTYELSWNVLKDWFETQGETEIHGSKDAFRLAFRRGVVQDGEIWMDMVRKRQLTMHTYSDEIAQSIVQVVVASFFPEFVRLLAFLDDQAAREG